MKLQNLTVIFIIITLPIILLVSLYISTGLKTIRYQALYDTGLLTATQDAIQAFETNTVNNRYSDNPEEKRSIIKSSIKMFEKSLCNTCNISAYDLRDIEEYIPAIVFGLYDGFYLYAPSLNPEGRYEHALKNYVYYSEILDEENAIVIRYYLDSYVQVSGYFEGKYESREGYLINTDKTSITKDASGKVSKIEYYGIEIDETDEWAVKYFVDNWNFSNWFTNVAKIGEKAEYLEISENNDPEDPNSLFVKHKNEVIRNKIEGVLNSTITAYSERTWGQNYKMPKITEEEWERIYSDISVTTFFQGKRIGFTKYNGYCVLNSNNHYELVNPNLLYFSTDDNGDKNINSSDDSYHDIRCELLADTGPMIVEMEESELSAPMNWIASIRGWKIGRFKKVKVEGVVDRTGRVSTGPELEYKDYNTYMYERGECSCYVCINGPAKSGKTVYDYIKVAKIDSGEEHANPYLTLSYWTSLARERARLNEKEPEPDLTVNKSVEETMVVNGGKAHYTIEITNNAAKVETVTITDKVLGSDLMDIKSIDEYKINGAAYTDRLTPEKLESVEGFSEDLAEGETLVIKYTANITDKDDSGTEVTNQVTASVVYEGSVISKPEWTKEATCDTIETELKAEKIVRQAGTVLGADDKIEWGTDVEYEIKITNVSDYDITDKITIEDTFAPEDITNIRNIKYNGVSVPLNEVSSTPGTLKWTGKDIGWKDTITITFTATIKGDIGDTITNYVKATSEYGANATADASISCSNEKTIRMQGSGGGDYHVILVLDSSTSMGAAGMNAAREAARDLIEGFTDSNGNEVAGIGYDNVTMISFAQSASVITSLNQYQMVVNGISTNYVAGLSVAQEHLRPGVNNYIIFMSDGGPTNTQGRDNHWSAPGVSQIFDAIGDGIEGVFAAVLGGWLELDWEWNEEKQKEEYTFRLLVTEKIAQLINMALSLHKLWGADIDEEIKPNVLVNLGFIDAGLSRYVWQEVIMGNWVNPLKEQVSQIYTIYFDRGKGDPPAYGLSQMATSPDNAFREDNTDELEEIFRSISEEIQSFEVDETRRTENGIIRLRLIDNIAAIRIGTEELSDSQLELVRNKITPNGDGSGDLNLRDPEIADIFKTTEEITVLY